MTKFKWTQEMRRKVYKRLCTDFGTYANWGQGPQGGDVLSPPNRKKEFEAALRELALESGGTEEKWTAIEQQVSWRLTRQKRIVHQNHFKTMAMNKTAAIEEGLLTFKDMPTFADLKFDATKAEEDEID
ncbi:MAG TPA: hypothetical protein VHX86_03395 [Tepidisphaeraceae bacterium]|jgi:hypothetical protein|nr:hypothetical protein [Tepidisphaeraceae bacterium]